MPQASFLTPRKSPRFAFFAEAEVIGPGSTVPVVARVSELSTRGCYVDTPLPFPDKTELRVRIRYGCSTCEFTGKVLYNHVGHGMGVLFGALAMKDRIILDSWLDELGRKRH